MTPEQIPTAEQMTAIVSVIREQDWFEIALDPDLPDPLYFSAVTHLHRRTTPLPAPVLEIWSAMRALARVDTPQSRELVEQAKTGSAIPVLAVNSIFEPGESGWVPFGASVMTVIAVPGTDGTQLVAVQPGKGMTSEVNAPDPTLPSVLVSGEGELLGTLSDADTDSLKAELLVAQSCAMIGQAEAMVEAMIEYMSTREQFGVPIGSFQALRHRASDVATDIYAAHQMTLHAGTQLADHQDPLILGLLAKALTGSAALQAASESVQLHGGMGFTWEGGVHFGLKRIMHHAMTGPTVSDCDELLGGWAVDRQDLMWAGGLDDAHEWRTKEGM
ncbi:acyl-CoA dehydrogenase family protein [Rhodococcus erythropolis]